MEQETLAARELKRVLFKKCHGLSLLTGCSVFLRIKDSEDGIQFYGTKDQVKRYFSSKMKHCKDDQEVSGETGLPKQDKKANNARFTHVKLYKDSKPMVSSNGRDRNHSDNIPNSTTNAVSSSDSGHSSTSEVISVSDDSISESECDMTQDIMTDCRQSKSDSDTEQVSEKDEQSAGNRDSSSYIYPRPRQIRDVMKEIIKRSDNNEFRKSPATSLDHFRERVTDVMLRRALLEQVSVEDSNKQLEVRKEECDRESPRLVPANDSMNNHAMQADEERPSEDQSPARRHTDLSCQGRDFSMEATDIKEEYLRSYQSDEHTHAPQGDTFAHTTQDDMYRESAMSQHTTIDGDDSEQNHPCGRVHYTDDKEQYEPLDFSRKRPADDVFDATKYMKTSEMYTVQPHAHGDVEKISEKSGSSNDEAAPDQETLSELQLYKISPKAKRRYQCGLCGKAFTQLSVLKEHVKTHTGEKPYTCKICAKEFSHPSNFKRHERLVHSGPNEIRRHQCPVCFKAFPLSHHLKEHFRIHSGERPYQCKTCGQRFKQSSTLKTHQKRHSSAYISAQQMSQNFVLPRNHEGATKNEVQSTESKDNSAVAHSYPSISPRQMQHLPYMQTLQTILFCGVPQGDESGQVKRTYSDNVYQSPAQISHCHAASSGHQSFIQVNMGVAKPSFSTDHEHSSGRQEQNSPSSPMGKSIYPPPLIHWPSKDHREALHARVENQNMSPRYNREENNNQQMTQRDFETSPQRTTSSSPVTSQSLSPSLHRQNSHASLYPGTDSPTNPNHSPVPALDHMKVKVEPDERDNFASCAGVGESEARDNQSTEAGDSSKPESSSVRSDGSSASVGESTNMDDMRSGKVSASSVENSDGFVGQDKTEASNEHQSDGQDRVKSSGVYPDQTVQESGMARDLGNRYVCSLCNKMLSCAATLREHQRVCHGVGQSEAYLCHKCGRGFSNHSNFKRHQRLMHNDVKVRRHQCPVCFKAFPLGHHLKEHFRIHSGERPYKCEICGKGFTQSSTLKNHKKTHPVGNRSFQCDICEMKCDNALALINHRMIHIVESCQCPNCGKKFNTPHDLATHRMKEYCPSGSMLNHISETNNNANHNHDALQQIKV